MNLRYDTKRNPVMTGVLIVISLTAFLFVYTKVDFSKIIFGEIGSPVVSPESPKETMTQEQYAEVSALYKQQYSQKTDVTPEPAIQIGSPVNISTEQQGELVQSNDSSSVYKYIDSSGMIVMVDSLEKVPVEYRAKMKISSGISGQQRTTVQVKNNQIWVPVTIGHKGENLTTRLLLDTGATHTSISPALAGMLGVQTVETTGGSARLADGSVVQTTHVVIEHVTVGPKTKQRLNVQIMPRAGGEITGLLGMDFLGDFPHIVEAKAGVIRWQ